MEKYVNLIRSRDGYGKAKEVWGDTRRIGNYENRRIEVLDIRVLTIQLLILSTHNFIVRSSATRLELVTYIYFISLQDNTVQ